MSKKIAIIGAGSWGTAVANVCADASHSVLIWGRNADVVNHLETFKENRKYLPGVPLNPLLHATTELAKALNFGDIIVCSVPTQQIRAVFTELGKSLPAKILVNTSKGIENGTNLTVEELFAELCPKFTYTTLSGPSFALEVAKRLPTAVTVASRNAEAARTIQKDFSVPYFRVYTSDDVIGVDLAGALKNVIAIASGVVAGLNLGFNARAALINRGIVEMTRLGVKRGANPLTFMGLAGMGDLVLTCTGPLSRNLRLGLMLGEGKKVADIQRELGQVAEGVYTAKSAYELSLKENVPMPITEQVYRVIYNDSPPLESLKALMSRELKAEWDFDQNA